MTQQDTLLQAHTLTNFDIAKHTHPRNLALVSLYIKQLRSNIRSKLT